VLQQMTKKKKQANEFVVQQESQPLTRKCAVLFNILLLIFPVFPGHPGNEY
jgi:hypothetical protein